MPRARRKTVAMLTSVCPTPERMRHDAVIAVPTEQAGVVAHQVRTPFALDRYHARGELAPGTPAENARRYDAGCRLRETWTRAGLEPRVTRAYDSAVRGGRRFGAAAEPAPGRIDAYRAWQAAIRAVGPIASSEVIDACCLGQAVGDKTRLEILRRGLGVLADHYGL
ncbi:MAG: DUF6456 domain-containing protein [Alphaproteobacteria bacterium]